MKIAWSLVFLALAATAEDKPQPTPPACLIVKLDKGQRREGLQGGLVGAAFSRGDVYDYVDAVNYPQAKMRYKTKQLEKIKAAGVHVVVVDNQMLQEGDQLKQARESCKGEK
jgi:hypothetical protein